ncbi:MAG: hypothetical protein HC876_09515 [Chloroflexaceae bacterium]|nr:hypothetical protein [Chloroflexaceae bacterium]
MPEHFFFYVGLAFILTHEMDAIWLKEWNIFPLFLRLPEATAYLIFTAIHVPLYILIFWGLIGAARAGWIVGLNSFCIIHVGLHVVFRNHKHNHFTSVFSWFLILGAGIAGALDLLFTFCKAHLIDIEISPHNAIRNKP